MADLDVLRLAVAPYPVDPDLPDEPADGDFVVPMYVNDVEMSAAGHQAATTRWCTGIGTARC